MVAEQADSLEAFGRLFQDWLHTLRAFSSRSQVLRAIEEQPPRLAKRFEGGVVSDAWLAAYAEFIAQRLNAAAPKWSAGRVAPYPWFGTGDDLIARVAALRDSPQAFKSRNLFVPVVDLPLRLRAGRPRKSLLELRRTNAERQRKFRLLRKRELLRLRSLARRAKA
jgi:hypothetical protein